MKGVRSSLIIALRYRRESNRLCNEDEKSSFSQTTDERLHKLAAESPSICSYPDVLIVMKGTHSTLPPSPAGENSPHNMSCLFPSGDMMYPVRTSRKRAGCGEWVWKSVAQEVRRNSMGEFTVAFGTGELSRVAGVALQPARATVTSNIAKNRMTPPSLLLRFQAWARSLLLPVLNLCTYKVADSQTVPLPDYLTAPLQAEMFFIGITIRIPKLSASLEPVVKGHRVWRLMSHGKSALALHPPQSFSRGAGNNRQGNFRCAMLEGATVLEHKAT